MFMTSVLAFRGLAEKDAESITNLTKSTRKATLAAHAFLSENRGAVSFCLLWTKLIRSFNIYDRSTARRGFEWFDFRRRWNVTIEKRIRDKKSDETRGKRRAGRFYLALASSRLPFPLYKHISLEFRDITELLTPRIQEDWSSNANGPPVFVSELFAGYIGCDLCLPSARNFFANPFPLSLVCLGRRKTAEGT